MQKERDGIGEGTGVSALNLLSGSDMTGQAMVNAMDNTGGALNGNNTNNTVTNEAPAGAPGKLNLSAANPIMNDLHPDRFAPINDDASSDRSGGRGT